VRAACPAAEIVVFDNNSTDRSAAIAAEKSVRVVRVSRQGKGNVVRAMLKRVEADVYVMLDADATYPAARIPDLLRPVRDGSSDMVVGARLTDVLSGYRAFTAEVARILPVVSSGFEVETEMTVQALFHFRAKELHSVITRPPGT